MHHIKNIPHYMYSMYHDIVKYKFVRKEFLSFIGYIVVIWITFYTMFSVTLDGTVVPIIAIMTVMLMIMWNILYFKKYYPLISAVHKEIELQDKYPYLYNKFIERE